MINKQGDVFTTEAEFIAHGCNVMGFMGAGVAAVIRDKYPTAYEVYKDFCISGRFNVGDCLAVRDGDKVILNLATQDKPGPHARLSWLAAALEEAAMHVEYETNPTIAMPQIGAGIGGLEWSSVEQVIKNVEAEYPGVQFEVWEYREG